MSAILPTPPAPGDPISATFMGEICAALRRLRIFAGPNVRLWSGPNGTVVSVNVPSPRPRKVKGIGCFEISKTEQEESSSSSSEAKEYSITFENCYYSIGGKTYELSGDKMIEHVTTANIAALKATARGRVQSATLVKYDDLSDLQEDQSDLDFYVMPLYLFGEHGKPTCDFRIGPNFAMGEF